jgi:hypothetical protein
MIIGELFTGVRILLEKAPPGYNISEDQQLTENIPKLLSYITKKSIPTNYISLNMQGIHLIKHP